MTTRPLLTRALLAVSAAIFALGGWMHARAYLHSARAYLDAGPNPFVAAELKALWLADSTTLLGLAVLVGCLVARPRLASGSAIALLALVPAGTTVLIYLFLGSFYAAHMLAIGTFTLLLAGALLHSQGLAPRSASGTGRSRA